MLGSSVNSTIVTTMSIPNHLNQAWEPSINRICIQLNINPIIGEIRAKIVTSTHDLKNRLIYKYSSTNHLSFYVHFHTADFEIFSCSLTSWLTSCHCTADVPAVRNTKLQLAGKLRHSFTEESFSTGVCNASTGIFPKA